MPEQRDLVEELSSAPPQDDVLAVLENAKRGHYAAASDEDLARDLEALRYHGPAEHKADWDEHLAGMAEVARAGRYRVGQEIQAEDATAERTAPPPSDTPADAPPVPPVSG